MKKLPYIPDKKMYAAVMGACSYVRDTGYFNKATKYYADKYDVDVDEVRKYVRIAQGNGQKQAPKRKYKWYVMIVLKDFYCADDCGTYSSWEWNEQEKRERSYVCVKRATSSENAKRQLDKCPSAYYMIEVPHDEPIVKFTRGFGTEKEANSFAETINWEFAKEYVLK